MRQYGANAVVEARESHELREAWSADSGSYVTAVGVSRNGGLLAVGTGAGEVIVFDVRSGAICSRVFGHAGGVLSLDWSPLGVLATAGQSGHVHLYDTRSDQLAIISGTTAWVDQVIWAPDGKRLATAAGRVVSVWTATGTLTWKTGAHEGPVSGLAWNRQGTEFVTACQGGIQFFRLSPDPKTRRFPSPGSLISLAWSPSGSVLACGTQERSVRFWRLPTGHESEISGFSSKPRALAWDAAGSLLATGGDRTVNVWAFDGNGPEGSAPTPLFGHDSLCTALAFHPSEPRLASGGDDLQVLLWAPRETALPVARGFLKETVTGLAWALGGQRLIGVDALGTVRAWCVD